MLFTDLLHKYNIHPKSVLALRHCPTKEPQLNESLPWIAVERPDLFNAYQSTQNVGAEAAMSKAEYVASFIGHEATKALFVGFFENKSSKPITQKQYWKNVAHRELKEWSFRHYRGWRSRPPQ
jgi:hypothetical protein